MPQKILVVDDSKTIRVIVARVLKECDCQVLEAGNGEEGLALAARETPDLLIIDAAMPEMDGATMCARLREDAALAEIPIVMLIAEAKRGTSDEITLPGVRECLVKPFRNANLIETIARIIPIGVKVTA